MASTPAGPPGARRPASGGRSRIRIASSSATDDFQHFYRAEWRPVLGLALVLTGDRTAAEDLVQEGFAAAYRDWHRIAAYDKPGAFVRRVVANRASSRRRTLGRELRALTRLAGHRQETGLAPEVDETWAHVRRLPARQAQVIALTYLDDLALAEVAAVLGISTETAKTHLARARRTLARRLDAVDDDGSAPDTVALAGLSPIRPNDEEAS